MGVKRYILGYDDSLVEANDTMVAPTCGSAGEILLVYASDYAALARRCEEVEFDLARARKVVEAVRAARANWTNAPALLMDLDAALAGEG